MISASPYKPAWTVVEAADYIDRQSGSQFDPEVVAAFKTIIVDLMDMRHFRAQAAAP